MCHHEAVITRDGFFYPTLTRIMDSFLLTTVFFNLFFIYYFSYLFLNKLPEVPEYGKIQFHMVTLLDVLGKITRVR